MKNIHPYLLTAGILTSSPLLAEQWSIDSQADWQSNKATQKNLNFKEGLATPTAAKATFQSKLKSFTEKKSASAITLGQSHGWQNWQPIPHLGPKNLQDAPIALNVGPGNYWLFGRYGGGHKKGKNGAPSKFVPKEVKLEGYDIPLKTTPFKNQYDAPGAEQKPLGGYHAWQSRDMKTWIHHGPVSDKKAKWMTTAEQVGDKTYFYYDFPNDQDPHLIIDDNLTDGKIGKKMGMAFKDPSHGSDSAIIRDLEGKFHLIVENWDPIKASKRSWDSPLASHAVSEDGIKNFKLLDPAVDYRTKPTGKTGTYTHPHWAKEDPANYKTNKAEYEIHSPEQKAYGDWAAIAIGGQYYLFGDYDPVGAHGGQSMSTAWFTSSDINKPFKFCGNIGKGHPDPDVIFAENQFYIISQTNDFVSSGPWVDGVEVRVGVDTDNDKTIDQWTKWSSVKESYSKVPGFAKQIARKPAKLDLTSLPDAYGFQFEIRLSDVTENDAKPILDKVLIDFK